MVLDRCFGTFIDNISDYSFQYFDCLTHKTSELDFHSIVKMISASRRIFLLLFIKKQFSNWGGGGRREGVGWGGCEGGDWCVTGGPGA